MSDQIRSAETVFSLYGRIFKNPAAAVFLAIFLIGYLLVAAIIIGPSIDYVELVKALPFAVSAFVIGLFSVLFWALNYIGRQQKVNLEIEKAEALFKVRKKVIQDLFRGVSNGNSTEMTILKAHLLLNGGEVKSTPETPSTELGFEYADAIKAVLRKS